MQSIVISPELFFRIATFIIAVYLFISSIIKTDVSKRRRLFLNTALIILAGIAAYTLRLNGIWLYALGIMLSGRLLGFPHGLITGILIALYTTSIGTSLYPFGVDLILLGAISDGYLCKGYL